MTQATAAIDAGHYANLGDGYTAMLAQVTVPGSIPPASAQQPAGHEVNNVSAWVVTVPISNGNSVYQGLGLPLASGATPVNTLAIGHFSVAINAQTGDFLVGFFSQ